MERMARTLMVWLVIWGTLAPPVEAGPLQRLRARVRERRGMPTPPPAVKPTAKPWTAEQGRAAVENSLARVSGFSGGSQATTALSQLTDDVRITGANAPSDGDALVYESASSTWKPGEAGGGGSGLTVTGTPGAGDTVVYRSDVATPGYYLQRSGAPVIDVKRAGASGSVLQGTGTISSGTATLALTDTAAQGADASDTYDTYNVGNGVMVVGAGAAHAIAAPTSIVCAADGASNSVTYTYTVYCLTNGGGWSAESSTVNTTAGATTLTDTDANYICWKTVSGANGYGVCGRGTSNRFTCFLLNSAPTAYALTFASDAGAISSDIGKPVSMTGGHTGTLIGESSDGQTWYVLPDEFSDDTFGSAAAISVTGGTGSGTTSGAATTACYIKDTGDATSEFVRPNRSLSRRASDESRTTDWKIHPFSASGVAYRVHHTRMQADEDNPKSSATANGSVSYTNTMGAITRDGDLYLVRENGMFPVVAPTSAVSDALYATVLSKSGTTLTLSDNAGTSVTNATVMHDDYAKINSAITAWQSATDTSTLFFPPGDYPIHSDLPSINVFSRWSTSGGGVNYLFQPQRANGKAGSIILDKNAWVRWRSMANGANETTASVATQGVFYLNGDNEITIQGGHWTHEYMSEPVLESADANASNGQRWLNDSSTGLDQFSRQRIIRDTEFFGFPSWYREENGRGRGEGTLIENVYVEYGAADDFCYYGCYGPTIRNLHVHGVQYSRSTGLYSAAAAAINPDTLIDGCTFYRTKRDGVRMRSDNTTIVNSRFIQSGTNALLLESFTGATINGNQFINGGMVNVSTNNITFNGNILQNVQLAIAGGTKFACAGTTVHWDSNAATYFVSDTYAINITGGTGITFSGLILDNDLADGGSNPDRGITITGGSNINFNGCDIEVAGERPLGISSGVTGPLSIAGGRIYGGVSTGINFAPDSDTCQLTMTGVTIDSSGSDETMLGSNGILYCNNCTFNSPVNFTTLDSLRLRNCQMAPTGSGTCTIATNGAVLTANDWGEEPTLTGTLLNTRGNTVAGSATKAVTLSASQNNYAWPTVCDTILVDANGAYSITGIVPRAKGVTVNIINVDASDTLTLSNASGSSSAGNQININAGSDFVEGAGDGKQLIFTGGATLGATEN